MNPAGGLQLLLCIQTACEENLTLVFGLWSQFLYTMFQFCELDFSWLPKHRKGEFVFFFVWLLRTIDHRKMCSEPTVVCVGPVKPHRSVKSIKFIIIIFEWVCFLNYTSMCVTEEWATGDNESSLTVIPDHSGEHFVSHLLGFVLDLLEIQLCTTSVGGFVQGCRCIFWFQHFSTVWGEVIKMCKYKYLKSRLFCEGWGLFHF